MFRISHRDETTDLLLIAAAGVSTLLLLTLLLLTRKKRVPIQQPVEIRNQNDEVKEIAPETVPFEEKIPAFIPERPIVPAVIEVDPAPAAMAIQHAPLIMEIKIPSIANDEKHPIVVGHNVAQAPENNVPALNEEKKGDRIQPINPPLIVQPISLFSREAKNANGTPNLTVQNNRNDTTPSSLIDAIRCPISLEIMQDPVMTMDGHTYDRKSIEEWFEISNTSPLTNLPLESMILIPNYAMKGIIAKILTLTPDPKKTREEVEIEQKQISTLLNPLEKYVYATGIQALLKKYQIQAKQVLLKLRTELHILNRCDSSDMVDKINSICAYIQKSKPPKNSKGYVIALQDIEKNIKAYYMPKLEREAVLRLR